MRPKVSTFHDITERFVNYESQKYGANVIIGFFRVRYPENAITKEQEQSRRAAKRTSSEIIFSDDAVCTTPQVEFLANSQNKERLIEAVQTKCHAANIQTVTANYDADTETVGKAISLYSLVALYCLLHHTQIF